MSKDYIMEGKRVSLRYMTKEDTNLIVLWRNREFVRRNFIYQEPFTVEGHLEWFRDMIETGRAVQFIIVENETKREIGSVYFRDINKVHQKAEYGIFIGEKEALGRGYGTEAAGLAVQYGFEVLKLHKIFLRVLEENQSAIKSYENAGFIREAFLRDDVCIQGKFRNIILMGIVNMNRG